MLALNIGGEMNKTHLKVLGVDARNAGQTDFEYHHQSACGYVRDKVTRNIKQVTCIFCRRTDEFELIHQATITQSEKSP
jgi:hypothetical protein|tara:strand:+ start:4287 stop:4523 length:237 start_codon:yes stop_codon:yes gene_type:complete